MLEINYGEISFYDFNEAVKVLESDYGYEGLAWDMVVASNDFEVLADFLESDGVKAELVND